MKGLRSLNKAGFEKYEPADIIFRNMLVRSRQESWFSLHLSGVVDLLLFGCPKFMAKRRIEAGHQLETVGKELRKLYSWNNENKLLDN